MAIETNQNRISQIQVGNITYDIADPIARDLRNNKLNFYCVYGHEKTDGTQGTEGIILNNYFIEGNDANFSSAWCGFIVWCRITQLNVKAQLKTSVRVEADGGITDKHLMTARYDFLKPITTFPWMCYEAKRAGGYIASGGNIKLSRAEGTGTSYNLPANQSIQIVTQYFNKEYFTNPYPDDVYDVEYFWDPDDVMPEE